MTLALIVIVAVVISGLLGYYYAASTVTPTSSSSSKTQGNIVNLEIVPDFGGPGYDAFVLSSSLQNGVTPTPASNTTAPGTNDNNITVSSGTTVTFVLTSIDTAVLQNFSGKLTTSFTMYNDTADGVISSQVQCGTVGDHGDRTYFYDITTRGEHSNPAGYYSDLQTYVLKARSLHV